VGGWTVVVAELPYRAPDSTVRFRPVPLALTRTRSVLVVDDEDAVRVGIRRFLEKVGFEVREAWSGRSALAQITVSKPPELVLTDLKMSDGTGAWFLDQLSRDFPDILRHTVIVTGDTDHTEVRRLVRETGCPVLRKPLELPQLLDVLDEVALRA
jgi:CheY-like chemotaxis protein